MAFQSREPRGHLHGESAKRHLEAIQRGQRDQVKGAEQQVPKYDCPNKISENVLRLASELVDALQARADDAGPDG